MQGLRSVQTRLPDQGHRRRTEEGARDRPGPLHQVRGVLSRMQVQGDQEAMTMGDISLNIDGRPVTVPAGASILEAARKLDIAIPVLCHHPKLSVTGACRV